MSRSFALFEVFRSSRDNATSLFRHLRSAGLQFVTNVNTTQDDLRTFTEMLANVRDISLEPHFPWTYGGSVREPKRHLDSLGMRANRLKQVMNGDAIGAALLSSQLAVLRTLYVEQLEFHTDDLVKFLRSHASSLKRASFSDCRFTATSTLQQPSNDTAVQKTLGGLTGLEISVVGCQRDCKEASDVSSSDSNEDDAE